MQHFLSTSLIKKGSKVFTTDTLQYGKMKVKMDFYFVFCGNQKPLPTPLWVGVTVYI